MTIDLTDTSTSAILDALRQARRRLGPALGMVLTLIVDTDEAGQYDAIRAASYASREHPCRVIGVITKYPGAESRLDAEIRIGETGPGETILLRLYGPLGRHAESVVAPLLLLDIPVVTWWPGEPPAVVAEHPLGSLAQRRITDAAASSSPREALRRLAAAYRPGDTDLSWTRLTPWRSLLAATLDQPYPPLLRGEVFAEPSNPSGDLLAAWLSTRLDIPVRRDVSSGPGITEARFITEAGEIRICRPDGRTATLSRSGEADQRVALHRREPAELLAEELRRLDPDEVYAESLETLIRRVHVPGRQPPAGFTLAPDGAPEVSNAAVDPDRVDDPVAAGGVDMAAATSAEQADEPSRAEPAREAAGR